MKKVEMDCPAILLKYYSSITTMWMRTPRTLIHIHRFEYLEDKAGINVLYSHYHKATLSDQVIAMKYEHLKFTPLLNVDSKIVRLSNL